MLDAVAIVAMILSAVRAMMVLTMLAGIGVAGAITVLIAMSAITDEVGLDGIVARIMSVVLIAVGDVIVWRYTGWIAIIYIIAVIISYVGLLSAETRYRKIAKRMKQMC